MLVILEAAAVSLRASQQLTVHLMSPEVCACTGAMDSSGTKKATVLYMLHLPKGSNVVPFWL